jgi:hypothetical protein
MSDDFIKLDAPDPDLEDRLHAVLAEWRTEASADDNVPGGRTDRTMVGTVAGVVRSLIDGLPPGYRMHAGAEVRAILDRGDHGLEGDIDA